MLATMTPTSWPLLRPDACIGLGAVEEEGEADDVIEPDGERDKDEEEIEDVSERDDVDDVDTDTDEADDEVMEVGVAEVTDEAEDEVMEEVGVTEVTEAEEEIDKTEVEDVAEVVSIVVVVGVAVVIDCGAEVVVCGVAEGRTIVAGSVDPPKIYREPSGIYIHYKPHSMHVVTLKMTYTWPKVRWWDVLNDGVCGHRVPCRIRDDHRRG